MIRFATARDAVWTGLSDGKLWLLHGAANPFLFALFAGWLLIPESRSWQLGASLLGVVALGAATFLLHAGTFAYLAARDQAAPQPLRGAYAQALRNLIAFAICSAAVYFVWQSADRLDMYRVTFPAYVRSMMPALMRRHVSRAAIGEAYAGTIFVIRWIVLPGLLLPFAASVARFGFWGFLRGGQAVWRSLRSSSYWLAIAVAAFAGVFLTAALIGWHPLARTHDASFTRESISMIVRMLGAYLLGLGSWLVTCSIVGEQLQSTAGAGRQSTP